MSNPNGTLYRTNDAYPPAVQPGGPGTPVTDPTQSIDSKTSRYNLGCGHGITRYDVKPDLAGPGETYPEGTQVLRLCCPACGYVQNTMLPAIYYNALLTPVLY